MPLAELTEASIVRLIDAFYAKVRRDPQLGPVFDRTISVDSWPAHLDKMCGFWSSVMLTTGRYKGNPLAVHAAVPDIDEAMFERWLACFGETVGELFTEDLADILRLKARQIAESLRLGLFYRPSARGLALRRAAAGVAQDTAVGGE
jgi:hemoglobin